MSVSKLSELKRLHALGFGVHLLRPNSKVPLKTGWSDEKRDTIKELVSTYKKGMNIGTKLGKPSNVGGKYLAVIDVDVKGSEKKHQNAAREWIEQNFPDLLGRTPVTHSGRGNGSMHVWLLVDEPLDSRKLTQSSQTIEVHMPSVKPSKKDIETLGKKKTDEGFRLRPAWEVDFMCAGRQVVLPPSIHPDTGKEYKWGRPLESAKDIKSVDMQSFFDEMPEKKHSAVGRPKGGTVKSFEIVDPDEMKLEMKLSSEVVTNIYEGEFVSDRSAYCFTVALSMSRAGFTDAEILGVLTNREYFIGDCAYQHAKTSNRQRAARWVYDYCIRKARSETDASKVFDCEVTVYDTIKGDAKKVKKEADRVVQADLGRVDWKKKLDRTDNDKLKPTLKNVVLILQHSVAPNVFKRDLFAHRDFYGIDTEWGGKEGNSLTDDDAVEIKMWFAQKWKIEPNVNVIFEAMISISIKNAYHPVREYLTSLEWDGVPRVNTWLKTYLNAECDHEDYLVNVSRKFLVAAVARIFQPAIKFDYMLILEGLQGIGKSTVGRILASEKWFLDSLPDLTDKDAALNLQGIWICEMGELASMKRQDVDVTKAFISRQTDKVRPPYGKRYVESHRQCVFFGTTNAEEYLRDKTGNRRFWPVKVHEVDFEGLSADRDQLWAEAMFIYDNVGEKLYLEDEVKTQAEEIQGSRVVEDEADVMFEKLSVWWKALQKSRRLKEKEEGVKLPALKFRTSELFDDFAFGENGAPPLKDFKNDNYHLQLASQALTKLGMVKVSFKGTRFWKDKKVMKTVNQYV